MAPQDTIAQFNKRLEQSAEGIEAIILWSEKLRLYLESCLVIASGSSTSPGNPVQIQVP
jgi:hypothetical protein